MAAVVIALPARCHGNIFPGTTIQDIDLSGISRTTADGILRSVYGPWEQHAITYSFGDATWEASLADVGSSVDYVATLDQAMAQGRGTMLDRYAALVDMGSEHAVALAVSSQPLVLHEYLATIGTQIDRNPQNARLVRSGDAVEIRQDVAGRQLDIARAKAATIAAIATGKPASIVLQTTPIAANVTAESLSGAQESALAMISKPILFTLGDETYPIDVDTLTDALAISRDGTASLVPDRMATRLDEIERAIFAPARNVMLGWDGGLYVVADDVDGVALDRVALEELLPATARSATRSAALPVKAVKAAARTDNVEDLGITGHIAYGSSTFAGSSDTRATNVMAAANNISYKLVGPGESLSFNDLLGPISLDNGFVEGSIILGDWAASDIGGGVCQVSTTVFRAALYAGFRFDEWHAHSWRLGFYEADGSGPGMDAAIYQPNTPDEIEKDLVFANPLDSWLLLMMVIDSDTVYAHLYGKDAGWTVEVFEPRIGEAKSVGEPLERVNPDLASGERQMVQHAVAGREVRVRRLVTDADGGVVSDGDFVSDYRSQPEAWEVGP